MSTAARGRRGIDREAFATAVRARFPAMPAGEEHRVARFACAGRTERVGVLSAAGLLSEHGVELAVVAHIRHRRTPYERLLACGFDREAARAEVRATVSALLRAWAGSAG